uniref:RNase H type-1 domain-containing protein n=1 Tax=Fagus sylvatica TaxID=28930 RepID=A0A2N9G5A9_FAGSY
MWTKEPKGNFTVKSVYKASQEYSYNSQAIFKEFTTLAVVARDENGQILNAWAKEHILCDPLQVEAAALFWAVQLATEKDFKHVIIEGDSKICIDAFKWKSELC